MIVENKSHGGLGEETNFDFKYIPDFHHMTGKGEIQNSGLKQQGVERRNLKTLIIAAIVAGVVSWFSMKATWSLFSILFGHILNHNS